MGKLLRRLCYWLHHRRADAELAEEIELHRAMRRGQLERSGLSAAEAATASRRLIGNAGRAREETRDVWGWTWFGDTWRDLRYGARALRKSPGFLLTAALMLSLGIGVNLAAFQVLDGVFWRPPQVRDPTSLVRFSHGSARGFDSDNLPYPAIAFLESNNSVLSALLIRSDSWTTTFNDIHRLTWGDDPANRPRASFVSANWFDELDYRPLQGRVFHQGIDDAPDAQPGVVISQEFWERHLNRDPDIVGQTVRINSRPALVRGIVPRDLMPRHDTMIWMPITQIDYFVPGTAFKTSWDPSVTGVHLFGRLRPGISTAAAREALRAVMGDLAIQQPKSFAKGDLLEPVSGSVNFLPPRRRLEAWSFTIVGFGLTLLILIIALLVLACGDLLIVVLLVLAQQ